MKTFATILILILLISTTSLLFKMSSSQKTLSNDLQDSKGNVLTSQVSPAENKNWVTPAQKISRNWELKKIIHPPNSSGQNSHLN